MKKFLAILLTAALAFSLTACGSNDNQNNDSNNNNSSNSDSNNANQSDEEPTSAKDALELLNTVWNSYGDDEKFPAAGGDMSEENMTMDAPGKFSIEDAEALDTTLGFPSASVEKIDDAASLVHMMNANTFTCGAFHAKSSADVSDLTAALKDNISQRQWMCGFPDKLVIVTVGDYVISFFGENEIVDTFKTKLSTAYPSAEIICDEPIA